MIRHADPARDHILKLAHHLIHPGSLRKLLDHDAHESQPFIPHRPRLRFH